MTWLELGSFIGLGVLTNTVFPMPFEPVLAAFGGHRHGGERLMICAVASLCAAAGAVVDSRVLGVVRNGISRRPAGPARPAGWGFYCLAAAAGLLPIPFSVVRIALLTVRPNAALFAGTVAVARFPRYLVTVHAWGALALPEWVGWVLAGTTAVIALEAAHLRAMRQVADMAVCNRSRLGQFDRAAGESRTRSPAIPADETGECQGMQPCGRRHRLTPGDCRTAADDARCTTTTT